MTRIELVRGVDRAAFWALALALILMPIGTALFEIFFGISMGACGLGLVLTRRQALPRYWGGAAAFLVVALISALHGLEPARSFHTWEKLLILTAGLAPQRWRPDGRGLAVVLILFASTLSLHSIVAIGGWLKWDGEVRTEVDYLTLSQTAVMGVALMAPLVLARTLSSGLRAWATGLLLILGTHCLLSGSRAALVCLGVLALAEIQRRSRNVLLVLPPLFFLAYAALPESRRDRIREAFRVEAPTKTPPSSLRMRLDMARTGISIAADRPLLGVGLGSVRHVYDVYKLGSLLDDPPGSGGRRHRKWSNLHSDYIQLLAETGFLGLAAYLAMLAQILFARIGGRNESDPLAHQIGWGIRTALWLFLVGGAFYKCVLNFYPWHVFVVLAGLDAALDRKVLKDQAVEDSTSPAVPGATGSVVAEGAGSSGTGGRS